MNPLLSLGLLASAVLVGAIENPAVYRPAHSADVVKTISQGDSILNLADDFGIASFYTIDDAADLDALSIGKNDESSQASKLVIVVNGVDKPDSFFEGISPLFTVDTKDDRSNGKFKQFLAEIPSKIQSVTPLSEKKASAEITIFSKAKEFTSKIPTDLDALWVSLKEAYGRYSKFNKRSVSVINDDQFVKEMTQLHYFLTKELESLPDGSVVTVNLNSLLSVFKKTGLDSRTYNTCKQMISNLLSQLQGDSSVDTTIIALPLDQQLLSFKFKQEQKKANHLLRKRESVKQQYQTCYTGQEQCIDGTGSCSGHGTCTLIGKCWTCVCSATVENGLTSQWGGQACQKEDISSQFHLLFWTTLFTCFVVAAGIKFMYDCGDAKLPGVLLAATVQTKRSQ